jgi:uncharacterized membrane protein YqjE
MSTPQMQRSVPELLHDIIGNFQAIVRSEFKLAKAELSEAASRAAKPASTLGAGLALGFYALGFLLLAAIYALSLVMATWLASLIVGGLLAVISLATVTSSAKKLKSLNPRPEKTIQTLQENVQWAKDQIK